jgi:hypothetical protein
VNANPTILVDSVRTNATLTTGTYTISLSNLTPSTTYHVRAFATNSVGTSYGGDSTFTTSAISAPFVTTTAAFGIGSNNANSGGNITGSGGSTILARGIVYSTSLNPSLASGTVITDPGVTSGSFTSLISGLAANTTYHVRAYATNAIGTSYGSDLTFTTLGNGAFAATYAFDGVTSTSGTTDPTAPPVVTGLIFGSFSAVGVTGNSSGAGRFSLSGWTTGATNGSDVFTSVSDSTTKYYEVTITPDQGSSMTLTSVTFKIQRSSTGARQAFIRSSANAYASNLAASISPANANLSVVATNKFQVTDATTTAQDGCTITLSGNGYTSLTTPVTFRFYGVNAEAAAGTFSIDNVVFSGVVQ